MKYSLALGLTCLAVPTAFGQNIRVSTPNTVNGLVGTDFGRSVVSLRNFNNGAPAYAVGAPLNTSGGPLAGSVTVHRSIDGSTFRTAFGEGSPNSCSGPGVPVGDQLGRALVEIGDFDNDGFDDLLATAPTGRGLGSGCIQGGFGGFRILLSGGGELTVRSNPANGSPNGLGRAAGRLADDSSGLPQFAVTDNFGTVHIFRRAAPFLIAPPVEVATISGFGQVPDAVVGVGVINGNAAFAVSGNQQVFIRDVAGNTLDVVGPPAGTPFSPSTGFGRSLTYFPDAVGGDGLVIGEPLFNAPGSTNGNEGRVHFFSIPGSLILWSRVGSPGDNLGGLLAGPSDVDADGLDEFICDSDGGSRILIVDRNNVATARPIILSTATGVQELASSLALGGDLTGDAFPDVVVGTTNPARARVYFGGPEASVTTIGSSCSGGGSGAAPILNTNAIPVIGSTIAFAMAGASPNSASVLFGGDLLPVPAIYPGTGCEIYLDPSTAVGSTTLFTDASGGWGPLPLPIPLLIGEEFGWQAVTISSTAGGALEFSNGLEIVVGW